MVSRPLFLACGIPASPANGSSVATAETALKHSVLPPLRSDGTTLAFSCGDVRVAEKRERLRNAQTDPSIVQIRRNDCFSASHLLLWVCMPVSDPPRVVLYSKENKCSPNPTTRGARKRFAIAPNTPPQKRASDHMRRTKDDDDDQRRRRRGGCVAFERICCFPGWAEAAKKG